MTRQATDQYIKICMKTWLLCEASAHVESARTLPRHNLIKECADCARACFALVSKLVSNAGDITDLVIKCLLHCRQCSRECALYPGDDDLEYCGLVSNICADTLKDIAVLQLN